MSANEDRVSRPRSFVAAMICALTVAFVAGCGQGSNGAAAAQGEINGSDTPVVLIVLDELPSANLMTADGQRINAKRYPQIASFASKSTWYRDNIAAGDFTAWAVPPIFTGNLSNEQTLPTTKVQPNSIFTKLGPGRRMHILETVTELCPKSLCPNGHQGQFPNEKFADEFIKSKFEVFEPTEVKKWIRKMPSGKRTLSVAHVESPHQPLRFTPEGKKYRAGKLLMPTNLALNGWTVKEPAVAFVQHRHLLQTGFADRIVGQIMRKIKRNGDFNRALIVLTADHGNSFDPDDLRRDLTRTNPGATVNPPLFIKYPGQKSGEVSTASTQSIDIFPTIAGVVGADIPATDGLRVSEVPEGRVMTVRKDVMRELRLTTDEMRSDRRGVLADQYRRLGSRGLWQLGPRSELIGRKSGRAPVQQGVTVKLDRPATLRQADGSRHTVPSLVSGQLTGVGEGRIMALAWNGKIVSTTRSFKYKGKVHVGAMVPPSVMKPGRNKVSLYLVTAAGLRRVPGI